MFIGHYAVGLAAKRADTRVSLGTLFFAAQFLDLLWPVLLLLGLEHVRPDVGATAFSPYDFYDYPISHSLLTVAGWSMLVGGIFLAIRRSWRGALLIAACVMSHWVLDLLTHRPDLPLAPGASSYVGLGLWNSVAATVFVEGLMFVAAVAVYLRTTRAKDRTGTLAFWGLMALLAFIYIGGFTAPEPVEGKAMAFGGLSQWLVIPWAYWIDRHRAPHSHAVTVTEK